MNLKCHSGSRCSALAPESSSLQAQARKPVTGNVSGLLVYVNVCVNASTDLLPEMVQVHF